MPIKLIGWDIGGAHLKAAAVDTAGEMVAVFQEPCPLWQGLDLLDAALGRISNPLPLAPGCRHAITMTGELADLFSDRAQGVAALLRVMTEHFPRPLISVFAGPDGFLAVDRVAPDDAARIASANWLASGLWTAANLADALFIDIGSTTTDIVPIGNNRVLNRGYTDYERMRYDELVYTGVARTPLMALADRAPFEGEWISLMAEHFATTADIYRVTGELPEHADQMPAADGGEKTVAGSIRRLARLFGRDAHSAPAAHWLRAARFLRECQLGKIRAGLERQLSRGLVVDDAPFVGAGAGRFLVRELAGRLGHSYSDFSDLFSTSIPHHGLQLADCAPAVAVASLALREVGPK